MSSQHSGMPRRAENIKEAIRTLRNEDWEIHLGWVKAHACVEGNELADKLAKNAAQDENLEIIYDKIPKSEITFLQRNTTIEKWQAEWNNTPKGLVCK